jgi:purine-binding chemotaxis protein CheW
MKQHDNQSSAYFTFEIDNVRYGVDTLIIQEVILLPEIAPLEEAPHYILGAVNLRGKTVPVLSLSIRLGRDDPGRCNLSDSLIVLEHKGMLFSIVVNQIREIVNLTENQVDPAPSFGEWGEERSHLISGIGRTDQDMIMILDKEHFFSADSGIPEFPADADPDEANPASNPPSQSASVHYKDIFCSNATAEDRAQFRARAERLKVPLASENTAGLIPIAIIELAGESLGIEMESVQGFSQRHQITPIPCCPPHILGSMNLRGDNITIVDIRALLNLPVNHQQSMPTIMILPSGEQSVGVAIHQVTDVIHVRIDDLSKVPIASGSLNRKHLKGLAPLGDKMLVIVDLKRLLDSSELVVNEEVLTS